MHALKNWNQHRIINVFRNRSIEWHFMICKDSKLWEQLYKSILELDYPLKRNDRGLYERIPHGTLTKDSWHEAFISFYHSHHVVCEKSQKKCEHVKYHSSLKKAIIKVCSHK
jgi:hypothetical protein